MKKLNNYDLEGINGGGLVYITVYNNGRANISEYRDSEGCEFALDRFAKSNPDYIDEYEAYPPSVDSNLNLDLTTSEDIAKNILYYCVDNKIHYYFERVGDI